MKKLASISLFTMFLGFVVGYWLGTSGHKPPERVCNDNNESVYEIQSLDKKYSTRPRELTKAVATSDEREVDAGDDTESFGDESEVDAGDGDDTASSSRRQSAVTFGWVSSMNQKLTPEHRRTMARRQYGMLLNELDLTEIQTVALLDLLAEQSKGTEPVPGQPNVLDVPQQELERNRREIADAIGEEKATRFYSLKKTLPARRKFALLRNKLEQAGEPLTEQQNQALIAIARDLEPPMPTPVDERESPPPDRQEERMSNFMREERRYYRDAAESILTPTQLKRLDELDKLDILDEDMASRYIFLHTID